MTRTNYEPPPAVQAENARYEAVDKHPVAGPILAALREQDARTYHGDSGDTAALALATASLIEPVIRSDERARLADLFKEHRQVIADYPRDQGSIVDLIVLLLGLPHEARETS